MPVANRADKTVKAELDQIINTFNNAPLNAQTKNTRTGENRSAIFSKANINVPMIKPAWTAIVI